MELAQGGVCATQVTISFLCVAIYWFHQTIVTCMRPFDHVPYASNWLTDITLVPS